MKYIAWTLFAGVAIVFSFQNCKKNAESADAVYSSSVTKVDLSQENILKVNLYADDIQTVQKAGNSYQVKYRLALKIDLQSGVLTQTSDLSDQSSTFCLTPALKSQLQSILFLSQICRLHREHPPETICTMQYLMPYAEIITAHEQFDLGSASDGCASDSVDLCETQGDTLKQYVVLLKSSYARLSCPN